MQVELGFPNTHMHMQNTQKKANLWLHLASWNLPDSQLSLESKTEPRVAKAQNYMEGGGDTALKKHITSWG